MRKRCGRDAAWRNALVTHWMHFILFLLCMWFPHHPLFFSFSFVLWIPSIPCDTIRTGTFLLFTSIFEERKRQGKRGRQPLQRPMFLLLLPRTFHRRSPWYG